MHLADPMGPLKDGTATTQIAIPNVAHDPTPGSSQGFTIHPQAVLQNLNSDQLAANDETSPSNIF